MCSIAYATHYWFYLHSGEVSASGTVPMDRPIEQIGVSDDFFDPDR